MKEKMEDDLILTYLKNNFVGEEDTGVKAVLPPSQKVVVVVETCRRSTHTDTHTHRRSTGKTEEMPCQ